ncbi:phosphomevalonate kinase [Virgibacillus kekensis]|uniref:phosphomevalonate kinase n=1 Tax=Virgibacillus kekensis TaxID=202261 RepID=A0ABV9DL86_9BACI
MTNTSMTVRVPGKLMIAGEFAVLEPYQESVVMAVDRYVYAKLEDSNKNYLSLKAFHLNNLEWSYDGEEVVIKTEDARTTFVRNAMSTVLAYLNEKGHSPNNFHLSIRSELDDVESGRKYGLGSSAAVVTAVVSAILKRFLPEEASSNLIFKLAAISHVKTQGSGSGADVAASSYGGFLRYSSFQADWLLQEYKRSETVSELLVGDWPYLSLEPITLPEDVIMCIGWTGNPASTSELIGNIKKLKLDNEALYKKFMVDSKDAVRKFLEGTSDYNVPRMLDGIKQNRRAITKLGQDAGTNLETPLLKKLSDLGEQYGGAGKLSGAGGGDCGIAFMPSREQADKLMEAWEQVGIKPLHITTAELGAMEYNKQDD